MPKASLLCVLMALTVIMPSLAYAQSTYTYMAKTDYPNIVWDNNYNNYVAHYPIKQFQYGYRYIHNDTLESFTVKGTYIIQYHSQANITNIMDSLSIKNAISFLAGVNKSISIVYTINLRGGISLDLLIQILQYDYTNDTLKIIQSKIYQPDNVINMSITRDGGLWNIPYRFSVSKANDTIDVVGYALSPTYNVSLSTNVDLGNDYMVGIGVGWYYPHLELGTIYYKKSDIHVVIPSSHQSQMGDVANSYVELYNNVEYVKWNEEAITLNTVNVNYGQLGLQLVLLGLGIGGIGSFIKFDSKIYPITIAIIGFIIGLIYNAMDMTVLGVGILLIGIYLMENFEVGI